MIIIPAIDIINGKCVRLTKGDYAQQKYTMKIQLRLPNNLQELALNGYIL